MESSNNYFELIEWFKINIDWLNKVLKGGELDSISIDGVLKPSITKEFADRFKELQNYIQGRQAYKTKAELDGVVPAEDVFLAEVWQDEVVGNNGLYGWNGTYWEKSKYDWLEYLIPKLNESTQYSAGLLSEVGIFERTSTPEMDSPIPFIVDSEGKSALAFDKESGRMIADSQQLFDMGVSNFIESSNLDLIPLLMDKEGKVAIGFNPISGEISVNLDQASSDVVGEKIGLAPTALPDKMDTAFAIVDALGRVAFRIGLDGKVHLSGNAKSDSKVRHYFIRGQSLSIGYRSQPALTTESEINALSFGYRPDRPSFSELDKMVEFDDGVYGETPASGAAGYYRQHSAGKFNGVDLSEGFPASLISFHSLPGVNIESLSKGSSIYDTTQAGAITASVLVNEMGLTYEVGAMLWVQGEANERDRTEPEEYAILLEKLIEDHNKDMRLALSNPNITMPLITYQTNHRYQYTTPKTALGQLLSSIRHPLVFMSGPIYQYDVVDHTHLTNFDSRRLGEKMMQAAMAVEKEGNWEPLRPIMVRKGVDNEIIAEFLVRYPPLVFDDSEVVNPGDYGFEVLDEQGNKQAIESITIGIGNTVIIRTLNPLPSKVYLAYAYHNEPGASSGRTTGARGNLRDSDPTLSVYPATDGTPYHQYNYCVTFKEAVL
ncbi:sialate O-acetylesterase [Vibrio alginolyticus]|uniref:sialate O-acetylesterase n=1 Tax=Vibrio alginolyticus TaxID=663 RepID=UPI003749606E